MIGCGGTPVARVSKDVLACRQRHVQFGPVVMSVVKARESQALLHLGIWA
jgi:hypothetical protein